MTATFYGWQSGLSCPRNFLPSYAAAFWVSPWKFRSGGAVSRDHVMELRLTHHRDRLVKTLPEMCQTRPQPSPFKSYWTSKVFKGVWRRVTATFYGWQSGLSCPRKFLPSYAAAFAISLENFYRMQCHGIT